jgi:uncharacterized protein (TIGR03083 family)
MTSEASADAHLAALRLSADRLRTIASGLTDEQLRERAYPADWTVAQVLSHLGSAAVIMQRRLDDALAGVTTPDDFAPGVWDVWNAKTPAQQRDDSLAADENLLARITAMTGDERERLALPMGPLTLGFTEFVATRLNEHALHTWDVDVAFNPAATLPGEVAAFVVDNLELVARYTAKPTGDTTAITVATVAPEHRFTIRRTPDSVTFSTGQAGAAPDVELPAEAFARLVYGRLDNEHTPDGKRDDILNTLRQIFPGP